MKIGFLFGKVREMLAQGIYNQIPEENLLDRQRYKLFFIFSTSGFIICLLESFHVITLDVAYTRLSTGLQLFSITFLLNFMALQRHKNLRVAFIVGILTGFFCIHLFNYYYGGIQNSGNYYYSVIIITTFMLLGSIQGLAMLFLSVVNQVYFYFISSNPKYVWNILESNPAELNQDFVFSFALAVLVIGALSNSLGSSKNVVIKKITEARNTLSQKNAELNKLSLVASKTDSAVIITDKHSNITWVNDGFTRSTGYHAEEVHGKCPDDFMHGVATDQAVVSNIQSAINEKKPFSCELEQYKKDGTTFWSNIAITPIFDKDNNLQKVVSMQADITERKKAEKKIKKYLNDLEKTNKELDEFAYVVSHDLKAPLHAISALTTWIEDDMNGKFSEETNDNFNIIKNRVIRMNDLISGLLEFARANHGQKEMKPVNLNSLIAETQELLDVPSNCKINIPAELPTIFCDKIRFQQIFTNIIGNAIKYNDKESIYVTIGVTDCEDNWEFSIRDNGPGIDPRFHDKIFVIFQTLNPRDTLESTGVGLSIVKKIIEEEGGRIWIDSELGHGVDFRFTWPKQQKQFSYRYQSTLSKNK
jgi:PAS domain S-box-containing protein